MSLPINIVGALSVCFDKTYAPAFATLYTKSGDNSVFRCSVPNGDLVVKPNYRLKLTPYAYMYLNVKYGTQMKEDNVEIIGSWLTGSKDCRCPITRQLNDALQKLIERYDFVIFDCEYDLKYLNLLKMLLFITRLQYFLKHSLI